ncbi:hypothetical protein [Nannocystis radixulma]|uniref:Uncharacterized protein n=1 Tax=Nannocystis radixulma TaxID=2995305 RepID=A0ABT5AZ05_9BACT|nr:hypothetical protein [Nannocystis radixulma]MDC0667070.1 hypothetical protein [Nannocystis radixulma]
MFRKIVMLFPVLAFALPLLTASPAVAWGPVQVGKPDQFWPEQIGKPGQVWPEQIGKPGQVRPEPEPIDPCAPVCVSPCINPDEPCDLPCELVFPCDDDWSPL